MQTGWQPYSIKVGDTYYGYNRFEPVGIIFGVSADLAEIASTVRDSDKGIIEDLEIVSTMLAASITENITNKTFLTGISDAIEAIGDPGHRQCTSWKHGKTIIDYESEPSDRSITERTC